MSLQWRPVVGHFVLRGGLHDRDVAVARCAFRIGNKFHWPGATMFLMAGGTAILHRVGFVKGMGAAAEFGVTGLAPVIDFLDSVGSSALPKTISHDLREPSRSQLPASNERFVMTCIATAG